MKESDGSVNSPLSRAVPETGNDSPTIAVSPASTVVHRTEVVTIATDVADAATVVRGEQASSISSIPPQARYVNQGQIAKGGMSTVHEVFDHLLRRFVAMKTLTPEGGDAVARFIEEAQITGQLDHPNIVPIYDMERNEQGVPWRLAMKLVQGETLEQWVLSQPGGRLQAEFLDDVLQVFLKVCDAVAFAHSRGVVHRDLKPSNIMVGTHGQVYLMDWGIATLKPGISSVPEGNRPKGSPPLSVERLTRESRGTLIGTPSFMAPEQANGLVDSTDERTDTYGLGGILYFILTRQAPHQARDGRKDLEVAREGQTRPPQEVAPGAQLPPGLCRIAMRALSPKPSDRYRSAPALKREVEDFLRGGGWLERAHFSKGQIIIEQGTPPGAAYIITAGHCELHKGMGEQRRFLRLMGAGEAFGETAIFGSTTRTATVIAATEVSVLVVTREALDQELDRRVWLRALVEAMAERYLEMDRKVQRLEEELAAAQRDKPSSEAP